MFVAARRNRGSFLIASACIISHKPNLSLAAAALSIALVARSSPTTSAYSLQAKTAHPANSRSGARAFVTAARDLQPSRSAPQFHSTASRRLSRYRGGSRTLSSTMSAAAAVGGEETLIPPKFVVTACQVMCVEDKVENIKAAERAVRDAAVVNNARVRSLCKLRNVTHG